MPQRGPAKQHAPTKLPIALVWTEPVFQVNMAAEWPDPVSLGPLNRTPIIGQEQRWLDLSQPCSDHAESLKQPGSTQIKDRKFHQRPIRQPISAPIGSIEGNHRVAVGLAQVIHYVHGPGLLAADVESREHVQDELGAIRRSSRRSR